MELFTPTHVALLLVAFIVLFGYKRLPDASRSIGRSLRILKAETKGLTDDGKAAAAPVASVPVAQPVSVPAAAPVQQPMTVPGAAPVQYVAVPVDPATGLPVAGYIPPATTAPQV